MNIKKFLAGSTAGALMLGTVIVPAFADSIGPFDFENPPYILGNIDGQDGWSKTGAFDVEVENVADFANAASFGFDLQALRFSNAVTSGSFGDQTFSPGLVSPANETDPTHFEASFSIGSTQADHQPGLFLSVSPDDGNGSRMSYVGFEDQADGIHVIFYDVTNAGPLGTVSSFNYSDVAILDRTSAHTVRFEIELVPGPANDLVKLYVDGSLVATGTTWEDYYRYDPEQTGNGNVVPSISKLLFRAGGSAATGTLGNGYLIDNVSLESTTPVPFERSASITAPTPNQVVSGLVDFTAYLNDDDADPIQWAVREGTCDAGVGTVFGNVDGHSDVASIDQSDLSNQTFSFIGDMSEETPGMYCFIYNPKEDSGESNIRETVEFELVAPIVGPPTDKDACKDDGWMTFNNPTFKNQGDCVSYVQSNGHAIGNKSK